MSTHARPLAVWLAAAPDTQLAALFRARGVRTDASWTDFFDAAEALLEPASIERMLPRLTRAEAIALSRAADGQDAGAGAAPLIDLALLRPDGTPSPPVAEIVAGRRVPMLADDVASVPSRERRSSPMSMAPVSASRTVPCRTYVVPGLRHS